MISFEEFEKLDLRVGEIRSAEKISDKTFKLTVDCNGLATTVLEGDFNEKELVGMQVVLVANLKPVKIRGVESQGMLLAATDDSGKPILLGVDKKVSAGSKIK